MSTYEWTNSLKGVSFLYFPRFVPLFSEEMKMNNFLIFRDKSYQYFI